MKFGEFYFTEDKTLVPGELKKLRPNKYGNVRASIILGKLKDNPIFTVIDGDGTREVELTGNLKEIQKLINDEKWQELSNYELTDKKTGKLILIKNIVKTKDFGGFGGGAIKASDYENAIVEAWNNQKVSKPLINKTAQQIVDKLKKEIPSNQKAEHIGSKQLPKESLSEYWKSGTFNTNRTPKPDFLIGRYNISLKMGGRAQLCSSKIIGAEGNRLIMSSLEGTRVAQQIKDEIKEMISLRSERKGKRKGVTFLHRGTKEDEKLHDVKYYEEQHKKLTKLLNEGCQGTEFKRNFVYEAMTGNKKFDDIKGKANFILAATFDGSSINFKQIKSMDLDKVVAQSKLYVSFKTASGLHYSAVRVGTNNEQEEIILNYFEERANIIGIDCKTLNEGITDWIHKVSNIIRKALEKGLEYIVKLFGIELDKFELDQDGYNFLEV